MIGAKPLRIRLDKVNEFIEIYDRVYIFVPEKYDAIYSKIRHLISEKITYVVSHNYAKIKVDSRDCLPLRKSIDFV